MSYKHIIHSFFAASCLFVTPILAACSEDEGEERVESKKVEYQEIRYYANTPIGTTTNKRLLLEVANITLHLSDSDGAEIQKTIKTGSEEIRIKRSIFPYNCRCYTTVSLKPNATIYPDDTYLIAITFSHGYYTSYGSYNLPGQHFDVDDISVEIKGNQLKNYIENMGEVCSKNFSFDANGEVYIR